MIFDVIPCGSVEAVQDALNGTRRLGPFQPTLPVGGLTLIFTTPAQVVTFGGALNSERTLTQIVADIVASNVAFNAFRFDIRTVFGSVERHIAIQNDTGFAINNVGTASALLRIPAAGLASTGAVDPAKIRGFSQGSTPGHYVLVISTT